MCATNFVVRVANGPPPLTIDIKMDLLAVVLLLLSAMPSLSNSAFFETNLDLFQDYAIRHTIKFNDSCKIEIHLIT